MPHGVDAACFVLLFQKQDNVPFREHSNGGSAAGNAAKRQGFNLVCAKLLPVCADSRFAKPRKFPKGNGFILFACTKRTKSTPEVCGPLDSGDGSKLYGKIFFVAFPAFVPKPVYGTTRFFGCFEPVRMGYCTADARPIFFENGLPHCKLTETSRIRKE